MKRLLLYLLVFSIVMSCKNAEDDEGGIYIPDDLPAMKIARNSAWGGDIVLHIYRADKVAPQTTRYTILSEYHNKPVGFYLLVTKPVDKKEFVSNGVSFLSMGDTSTNFLTALADIYKVKMDSLVFADTVTVTYANLAAMYEANKPGNTVAAQAKLFFTLGNDTPELYLNIYENNNSISLPEKDSAYRRGILRALSKK